jgi:hypothetical protein
MSTAQPPSSSQPLQRNTPVNFKKQMCQRWLSNQKKKQSDNTTTESKKLLPSLVAKHQVVPLNLTSKTHLLEN